MFVEKKNWPSDVKTSHNSIRHKTISCGKSSQNSDETGRIIRARRVLLLGVERRAPVILPVRM